jgi:hypothetical protein
MALFPRAFPIIFGSKHKSRLICSKNYAVLESAVKLALGAAKLGSVVTRKTSKKSSAKAELVKLRSVAERSEDLDVRDLRERGAPNLTQAP